MVSVSHHEPMFALVLIPIIALTALAIYFYGADSRIDEVARRRHFDS
jgi:hypothetical protein